MTLRKIYETSNGTHSVRVYRDAEWGEYRVRCYPYGKLNAVMDYHTKDKQDWTATAAQELAWMCKAYPLPV